MSELTTPTESMPASVSPTVLLIDDAVDVHRLLKARLSGEAISLLSAMGGEEGLQLARGSSPAIILLDLDMPGMDGFEVLRQLKDDAATVDIPVIVLSGLSSPHDKVTAFDLGAVDYIGKPFELTELRVRVLSALRLHNLLRMLEQRAQIDGLTGLWNRAHFDRRWEEEVARAGRHKRPLSLAVLDLDHFKSINDTYGHPAGDAVIQDAAAIIQHEARASDIPCRYGGEEFVIIMTDTSPEDATHLCERIRMQVEARSWPRHPTRRVTISVGVAGAMPGVKHSAAEWLERADRALYTAKQSGRNRVHLDNLSGNPGLAKAS